MPVFTNWVEGEYAGDFESLDDALHEAAVTAYARHADVIVADDGSGAEWAVEVRRATSGFDERE